MHEREIASVERVAPRREVGGRTSIEGVPEDGMPDVGEMDTDLVRHAGADGDRDEAPRGATLHDVDRGLRRPGATGGAGRDHPPPVGGIVRQR